MRLIHFGKFYIKAENVLSVSLNEEVNGECVIEITTINQIAYNQQFKPEEAKEVMKYILSILQQM